MSTSPIPPDRPEIPKYRHHQIDALKAMFGESDEPISQSSPAQPVRSSEAPSLVFTPLPGTLGMTPTGATSWTPAPWPDWAPEAGPDATELYVFIDHTTLDSNYHPRKADAIAALKMNIERFAHRVGIYRLPIKTPPRQWTPHTVRALVDTILPLIPNDDLSVAKSNAKVDVEMKSYSRRGKRKARIVIDHGSEEHAKFYAVITIEAAATSAMREWLNMMPGTLYDHNEIDLATIDAMLSGITPSDASDGTDDDDDLDVIEKSARRLLHGEKNIPNTSQPRGAERTSRQEVMRRYHCSLSWLSRLNTANITEADKSVAFDAVAVLCDRLLQQFIQGRRR